MEGTRPPQAPGEGTPRGSAARGMQVCGDPEGRSGAPPEPRSRAGARHSRGCRDLRGRVGGRRSCTPAPQPRDLPPPAPPDGACQHGHPQPCPRLLNSVRLWSTNPEAESPAEESFQLCASPSGFYKGLCYGNQTAGAAGRVCSHASSGNAGPGGSRGPVRGGWRRRQPRAARRSGALHPRRLQARVQEVTDWIKQLLEFSGSRMFALPLKFFFISLSYFLALCGWNF